MILVASSNDYANLGHSVGCSLRSIGIDCKDVSLSPHPFAYGAESATVTRDTLSFLTTEASHVLIMHSCPTIYGLNKNRNFSVYHTGTRFRESPEYFLELFQSARVHLTDQTEFMVHPVMNYVVCGIDKVIYKPKKVGKKIILGHYPSNPEVKGSNQIIEWLKPFRDKFEIRIGLKQVSYAEQLKRMSECDVYIELFKPELNGRPYGCFGVTALEASMMGKCVITQDLEDKTYKSVYGEHPFVTVRNEFQFNQALDSAFLHYTDSMQNWIHKETSDRHSLESTGKRLMELLRI